MTHAVLIVEDNHDTALVFKEYLEEYGFRVDVAASGVAGAKYLERKSYDILVSDYKLPDMNADEMLESLKGTSMPVTLFLSGFDIDERRLRQIEKLRFVVVKKPCKPTQILQHMRALLGSGS